MNEVEKMYRNSGIKECNRLLKPCPFGNECDGCEYNWYPEFTAEKQLELIKWLATRFNSDYVSYWHNEIKDVWIFRLNDLTELSSEEPCIYEGRNKDFTEALCNLINDLWQSLTEEEYKQIKEILE